MIDTITQWASQYPNIIHRIDQVDLTRGTTKRTYKLKGKFVYNQAVCHHAIFKHTNSVELQFYQSELCTPALSPQPLIIDAERSYVLLEYLEPSPKWTNQTILAKVFSTLHRLYNTDIPDWLSPYRLIPSKVPQDALAQIDIDDSNRQALHKGIALVEQYHDMIANLPIVINHGDLHSVNAGMRNHDIVLYDWQTLRTAPIEYDLSYLFYILTELKSDMPSEAELYQWFQEGTGISLNQNLCRILYLYRSIYDHIPKYIKRIKKGDQTRTKFLYNRIPVITRRIHTWYRT